MGRRVRRDVRELRDVPLHARTRSVDAWHRSGHWMTTRRRDRVRVWPWKTASRPMHSSHIAWPQTSVTVVESKQMAHVGASASSSLRRRLRVFGTN